MFDLAVVLKKRNLEINYVVHSCEFAYNFFPDVCGWKLVWATIYFFFSGSCLTGDLNVRYI